MSAALGAFAAETRADCPPPTTTWSNVAWDPAPRRTAADERRGRERPFTRHSPNALPIITAPSRFLSNPFPRLPRAGAALRAFRAAPLPIDKYVFLRKLQSENADAFYRLLMTNAMEIMPFVYTPTVGEACETYHRLPVKTNGVYITADDAGNVGVALRERAPKELSVAAPSRSIGGRFVRDGLKVAVVTDGERILGLGDLGAGGMAIAEGKILLYTVCAGVDPKQCLPVCLDVGTDNERLLGDPKYKGLRRRRLRGSEYDSLVEEFMAEMRSWQPRCLVQFEDFGNQNAFRLLEQFRRKQPCFNDDIQGTACVALAGLLSASRLPDVPELKDQTFLFYGAGEAGVGIGELVAMCLEKRFGLTHEEAMRRCFFMDSKGLVTAARYKRGDFEKQRHKIPFAHDGFAPQTTLIEAIETLKPTALIGVSTIAGAFDEAVLKAMADLNTRPIVMPLSNPTHKAECTFADAIKHTDGNVAFASGSPFEPISFGGKTLYPAQANNAYVFPALGHAAVLADAKEISDDVFLAAAESLAVMTSEEELSSGKLFPDFDAIQETSKTLTAMVCEKLEQNGQGRKPPGVTDWRAYVDSEFYRPPEEVATRAKL
jgi:malate dehydrogenase (oxaloacetate-decarboxylating)(NADP+)